ncbi:MAG: exodeoxyribonuclease V subunit gamma [Micrococcales bacterium]|nr:exodeoxyribonuclease V subunit gamma [Micrococcales bacterium]
MTLHVHRANAIGELADGLAELLARPLADPFAQEFVAVPAKGVERWLAQRLSHRLGAEGGARDGVCAGVRFLNPHSLVALVLGVEYDDPWHPDRLAWAVLRAIDESLDEPWATTLAAHLGHDGAVDDPRRGRRYAVARRLAGLFASYAVQRPSLITAWRLTRASTDAGGTDEGAVAATGAGDGDGLGGLLEPDLSWQPHLWRRVLDLVDAPPPDVRHGQVIAALRSGDDDLELPGRLSLFGHTRIAVSEAELIGALAQRRDVHLWLPQASPAAWDALAAQVSVGPIRRAHDRSVELVRHPLLAGFGRDARELQRTLCVAGGVDDPLGVTEQLDSVEAADAARTKRPVPTLLRWLQADLREDHVPDPAERATRTVSAWDRSVQIHACHGAARQVEVLREVVTGLLADDPTLEPRDILVMCPDIDVFAPLVHAGFGLDALLADAGETSPSGPKTSRGPDDATTLLGHPAHGFRVRLADRAPSQTNPLLELAARLITLADSRLTVGEVLDLARSAPVRRRFGFEADDLDRMGDWVGEVTVRWGLDEEHRGDYGLSRFAQNTWRSGLDRILVGAALDGRDHDHLGTTLALPDLDSSDIDLVGRFAEFINRLGGTLAELRGCDHAAQWVTSLREGVRRLAEVNRADAWQLPQFTVELARIEAAAAREGDCTTLRLADVHALLAEHLTGRATRSNFRTGTLTVCTMVPMRSVPHRVVCLVGLDDGVFPRAGTPDGDDVLARAPVTGERDARSEDRQLLLDAVMSAGDTLVVTYTGADEHTGRPRPAAVPLGELIDALATTASGPGVQALVTRHPLQTYDPRNFGATTSSPRGSAQGLLRPDAGPFAFDPSALAGATAALGPRVEFAPFEGLRLPAVPEPDVDLDDLIRFLTHPARAFLRTRLGIRAPQEPGQRSEGIPLELDGLSTWHIGDRMLRAVLGGRDLQDVRNAELWRGELPPGLLGGRILDGVTEQVKDLATAGWAVLGQGAPGQPADLSGIDLDIDLPGPPPKRSLWGTVPQVVRVHPAVGGVEADGARVGTCLRTVEITYSTVGAAHRLRSWLLALALNAGLAEGSPGATSHVLGQSRRGRRKVLVHYAHGPVPPRDARRLLADLVELRDRGLREPLALPVETACAWASAQLDPDPGADPFAAASSAWTTNDNSPGTRPGEQDDPSHLLIHGGPVPLDRILGEPAPDELWSPGVTSRLGQLALRVWAPILTCGAEHRADG